MKASNSDSQAAFRALPSVDEVMRDPRALALTARLSRELIQMMQLEHENAGNLLKEIAALSMNYTTPEWACNTFKALYAKLDEFEQDLHLHVHLENNILFPKALEMERNFQILN